MDSAPGAGKTLTPNERERIEREWPVLRKSTWAQTSLPDPGYNCIAHAAGDSRRFWDSPPWGRPQPGIRPYWPTGAEKGRHLAALESVFLSLGYVRAETFELETGIEKVALYEIDGKWTHAARQLADGNWSSKLGRGMDISHPLDGLNGKLYGKPALAMKRPRTGPAA